MKQILHNTEQLSTKPTIGFVNNRPSLMCTEDNYIKDSHFVAALVFFDATVERNVNAVYYLSQSNPVTASNSYRFDMKITLDFIPKAVNDNALGVPAFYTTTVAFF